MRVNRTFLVIVSFFVVFSGPAFCAASATPVAQQQSSAPPLHGNLSPGPYRIGFHTIFRFDTSRTWKNTRNLDRKFSPDLEGRPIQINIWYPAASGGLKPPMKFGDYVDQRSPKAFSQLNTLMRNLNRENAKNSVPPNALATLLATPMRAIAEAPFAAGRFPVVLYFGGLGAEINSNVILAEYLASHGYIVASVSLLGPSEDQSFQSRTSENLEATVRDMEFARSILSQNPHTDKTRLAVMGHSVGGIEAAIFGMRNANVSAVISLDGTYGFPGLSSVLTESFGYAPAKMSAAFMDLRRAQGAQGNEPLDYSVMQSFRYSDRTLITIAKMHHSDFTSFAMVGSAFHTPITATYPLNGWNRETARSGYQQTCRAILAFLDAKLRSDPRAMGVLSEAVSHADGGTIQHQDAATPPPSPQESATLVNSRGLEAAQKVFTESCGNDLSTCINADRFNSYGYNLLGQKRAKDALAVFQLNAWAHPTSANTQDSLSDGYVAVEDKVQAKKAIQKAIDLAPADPSMNTESKQSFLNEESRRLKQLD